MVEVQVHAPRVVRVVTACAALLVVVGGTSEYVAAAFPDV